MGYQHTSACSSCEWESTPTYFCYDEDSWKEIIKDIRPALDVPQVRGVQVGAQCGVWATDRDDESDKAIDGVPENIVEFKFDAHEAGWRQGNSVVRWGGDPTQYTVFVELYNKYNASETCWANFTITLEE